MRPSIVAVKDRELEAYQRARGVGCMVVRRLNVLRYRFTRVHLRGPFCHSDLADGTVIGGRRQCSRLDALGGTGGLLSRQCCHARPRIATEIGKTLVADSVAAETVRLLSRSCITAEASMGFNQIKHGHCSLSCSPRHHVISFCTAEALSSVAKSKQPSTKPVLLPPAT